MLKIISYLSPILVLFFGLMFMALISLLKKPILPSWLLLLIIFIVFNIAIAHWFGITERLLSAWDFYKVPHFFLGLILGLLPVGLAILLGFYKGDVIFFSWEKITFGSLIGTLAVVCWEELWFRGMALELGVLKYSALGAAIIFGFIFLVLHVLNPEINLVRDGIGLFLAGYALGICYIVFGSIWAPIGMHFANNFTEVLLKENKVSPVQGHLITYTVILAIVAVGLTMILLKDTFKRALL